MLETAPPPSTTRTTAPAPTAPPAPAARGRGDIATRAAGLGALGFVTLVVAQNVVRGGSAPANDADATEVLAHYADHRAVTAVLVASFVVGGASLAVFLGGAMRRLVAGGRPGWAYTGLVGAAAVLGLFAVVVASEEALSVVAHGDQPDLGAVQALWALHNTVFAVVQLAVGIALLGLARAGVAAGITPAVFDRLAPVGAALLAVGAAAGPFVAAGEAMPLFGLGLAGFAVWLAFLVTTGIRLVRTPESAARP
jgi:hypothetical protein